MKQVAIHRTIVLVFLAFAALSSVPRSGLTQVTIGTSFTYQGSLQESGLPADGLYDFEFALFDTATSVTQIGSTITRDDVQVRQGLFTTALDFGMAFAGEKRFLEIRVRAAGSFVTHTLLSPRQELTPTVYANFATEAGNSDLLDGLDATDFVRGDHTHNSLEGDFFTLPKLAKEIVDGNDGFNFLGGAVDVFVSGNLALVAAATDHSVTIMDISNPSNPILRSVVSDALVGDFSNLRGAATVFVSGNRAYVAAQEDSALTIMDISNPASPTFISDVVDGVGGFNRLGTATWVYVSRDVAYVTAVGDNALTIIDVSNPFSPSLLAEVVDEVGGFTKLAGAWSVTVSGNLAFVTARTDDALTIIDVTNPASPQLVAEVVDGVDGIFFLEDPREVFVEGDLAFVVSFMDNALTILDISTPSAPKLLSQISQSQGGTSFTKLQGLTGVSVANDRAFLTSFPQAAVTIVDVTIPTVPRLDFEIVNGEGGFNSLVGANSTVSTGVQLFTASAGSHSLTITDLFLSKQKVSIVGGRVGIGTQTPRAALEVQGGNIRVSQGAFIDDGTTLNVPDYVFEPGYPLMTLAELQAFIEQNRHLPNVPDAEDVRSYGLNLSRFQMRLLEKIEELTLYTLEQQRQLGAQLGLIESQGASIEAQKNEIDLLREALALRKPERR